MTGQINVNKIAARTGTTITIDTGDALDVTLVKAEGSATTNLKQGLAKAWGNFHEPDPVTLRDNLNVTGLTDNGTGYFTVNITNSMNNDDYVRIGSAGENANSGGNRVVGLRSPSTGSFNLFTCNTGGSASDTQDTCVAIFGDLA